MALVSLWLSLLVLMEVGLPMKTVTYFQTSGIPTSKVLARVSRVTSNKFSSNMDTKCFLGRHAHVQYNVVLYYDCIKDMSFFCRMREI